MIELEYKYTLTERGQMSRILALGDEDLSVQRLAAIYFNDQAGRLDDARFSLRLRRENNLLLLTLKVPSDSENSAEKNADPALQTRYEWTLIEWAAAEFLPDADLSDESKLLQMLPGWLKEASSLMEQKIIDKMQKHAFSQAAALLNGIPAAQWVCTGGTRIVRHGRQLVSDGYVWHLTIDDGVLFSGSSTLSCLEVEFELVSAPDEASSAVPHPLADHPVMRFLTPEARSKQERILELYHGHAPRTAVKPCEDS